MRVCLRAVHRTIKQVNMHTHTHTHAHTHTHTHAAVLSKMIQSTTLELQPMVEKVSDAVQRIRTYQELKQKVQLGKTVAEVKKALVVYQRYERERKRERKRTSTVACLLACFSRCSLAFLRTSFFFPYSLSLSLSHSLTHTLSLSQCKQATKTARFTPGTSWNN